MGRGNGKSIDPGNILNQRVRRSSETSMIAVEEAVVAKRKAALSAFAEKWGVSLVDNGDNKGDDYREYIDGKREIKRYAVITVAGDSTDWTNFIDAGHETLEAAKTQAMSDVDDDVMPEDPVAIIDLDSGEEYLPENGVYEL